MIWNLGLPKTGTVSLAKAVWQITSQRMVHSSRPVNERLERQLLEGEGRLQRAIPAGFCGAGEMPAIRQNYQKLYEMDPDGFYIITTREVTRWLDSMETHGLKNKDRQLWDIFYQSRKEMYETYVEHFLGVLHFFRSQGKPICILDIEGDSDQENWAKLSSHLSKDPPEVAEFPWENRTFK